VVATDPDQCLASADAADAKVIRGEPTGRLHGLPVVVQDVMAVAASLLRWGGSTARDRDSGRDGGGQAARRGRRRARPDQRPEMGAAASRTTTSTAVPTIRST
jgi:hypothetical protein